MVALKKRKASERHTPSKKAAPESVLYSLWKQHQEMSAPEASNNQDQADPASVHAALQGPVEQVWRRWAAKHPSAPSLCSVRELLDQSGLPEESLAGFHTFEEEIRTYAEFLLERGPDEPPMDAQVRVCVSPNSMAVWCIVFPPQNGGSEMDGSRILDKLRRKGIVYGLDGDQVVDIVLRQLYCRVFVAARGQLPVDGEDGQVVSCLAAQTHTAVQADSDGQSLKSSIVIQHISKGEPICRIIQPTEAVSGVNVYGSKVNGHNGRHASLPRCKNTTLSPDGAEVIATVTGQVTYDENQFTVEELLVIDGNVDLSVGDIDYSGDVVINGSVLDRFMVRASGNITIHGLVENARLHAGGNIVIDSGMNGNSEGTIAAGKDVTCKYLENCTVYAGGCIYTSNIICCEVACEDVVYATQGKGAIVGGSCTSLNRIEAGVIGTNSHRSTTVTIGSTPQLLLERKTLEAKLEQSELELESVLKDITYLESMEGGMPAHRKPLYGQLKLRKPILLMQIARCKRRLEEIAQMMEHVPNGRILCGSLYPQTKIVIGNTVWESDDTYYDCILRLSGGEIIVGSL